MSFTQVAETTGIPYSGVSRHTNALKIIGLLRAERTSSNQPYTFNTKHLTLVRTISSLSSSLSSSSRDSRLARESILARDKVIVNTGNELMVARVCKALNDPYGTRKLSLDSFSKRGELALRTSVKDILKDEDWKRAQEMLLKYFSLEETRPIGLERRGRFKLLCAVLLDESFDFEDYCRWYKTEKHGRLKFRWHMFLLRSMREEYLKQRLYNKKKKPAAMQIRQSDRNSESYKKKVQATKDDLKRIARKAHGNRNKGKTSQDQRGNS